MTNNYPQRARGTHRAEGNIAFANRQKHRIIAFQGVPFSHLYFDQITDDIYYKYTPSARFFKAKYIKNKRARSMKNR